MDQIPLDMFQYGKSSHIQEVRDSARLFAQIKRYLIDILMEILLREWTRANYFKFSNSEFCSLSQ